MVLQWHNQLENRQNTDCCGLGVGFQKEYVYDFLSLWEPKIVFANSAEHADLLLCNPRKCELSMLFGSYV